MEIYKGFKLLSRKRVFLSLSLFWKVFECILSDHFPIIIKIKPMRKSLSKSEAVQ